MVAKLLNLRPEPKPIIIEKVIQAKRIWWLEILKMVTVITVVSSIVYGISKADVTSTIPAIQNFSARGIVSDVALVSLSIEDANSSDKSGNTFYTFDVSNVKKIENRTYVPLRISDIHTGDQVVVQGLLEDGIITIRRIISLSSTATTSDIVVTPLATSTVATSTLEIASSTASTTSVVATSTASSTQSGDSVNISTTNASSTLEIASSTASTTSVVATSTASTTSEVTATSTATTTDITATTTSSSTTSTDTTTVVPSTDTTSNSTPPVTPPADPVIIPPADSNPPVVPPAPVTPPADSAPVAPDPTPSN